MTIGGSGLSALALAVALAAGVEGGGGHVYTNDDLERVRPRRGETGVASVPASPPQAEAGRRREGAERTARGNEGRGEAYWRRESERVADRVQPWREAADDLRTKIAERQRQPGVRPYSDPQVVALQRRLAALEGRIRDAEDRLSDRARRAGALPGWLR